MTGIMYVRTFSTHLMTGIRFGSLCNIPYDKNNVCHKVCLMLREKHLIPVIRYVKKVLSCVLPVIRYAT